MSEVLPEQKVPVTVDGLEYDYYRFFMLISLLVLSGVVTLAASAAASRVPMWFIALAATLSVAGASLGFACQSEMVRLATGRLTTRKVTEHAMIAIIALFACGMTMFFYLIVGIL